MSVRVLPGLSLFFHAEFVSESTLHIVGRKNEIQTKKICHETKIKCSPPGFGKPASKEADSSLSLIVVPALFTCEGETKVDHGESGLGSSSVNGGIHLPSLLCGIRNLICVPSLS